MPFPHLGFRRVIGGVTPENKHGASFITAQNSEATS